MFMCSHHHIDTPISIYTHKPCLPKCLMKKNCSCFSLRPLVQQTSSLSSTERYCVSNSLLRLLCQPKKKKKEKKSITGKKTKKHKHMEATQYATN